MTTTTTAQDEQIRGGVLAELSWDAKVRSNEVGVAVKGSPVTLTGWVAVDPWAN